MKYGQIIISLTCRPVAAYIPHSSKIAFKKFDVSVAGMEYLGSMHRYMFIRFVAKIHGGGGDTFRQDDVWRPVSQTGPFDTIHQIKEVWQ
jgi:hypothetical protein